MEFTSKYLCYALAQTLHGEFVTGGYEHGNNRTAWEG